MGHNIYNKITAKYFTRLSYYQQKLMMTTQQQQQISGAEVDAFLLNAFAADLPADASEPEPEPEVSYTDDDLKNIKDDDAPTFTDAAIAARNNFEPQVFEPIDSSTPRRGKPTQDAAVKTGKDYLLYTLENGYRSFHAFETHRQREIATATWISRGVEVHERCIGTKLSRPFLDIDGNMDLTDDNIKYIIGAFIYTLKSVDMGMPQNMEWHMNSDECDVSTDTCIANFNRDVQNRVADPRTEVAVWGYTSNTKRSLHIVAQQVVTTGANIKRIAQRVKDFLPEGPMRDSVDAIGNDSSFGLRLPNCGKGGDMSRKLEFKFATTVDDHVPTPWLRDDTCDDMVRLLMDPPVGAGTRDDIVLVDAETTSWVGRVTQKFPYFELDGEWHGMPKFSRTEPAHCDSCDRTHETEGAYTNVKPDGTYFLNCRRAPTGSKALMIWSSRPDNGAWKKIPMPKFDSHDTIIESADTVASERYNTDAFDLDVGADTYLRAPWKSGKNYFMVEKVRKLRATKPDSRILIVTCRKTLTAGILASFNGEALSYQDIKGAYTEEMSRTQPILVCQIESLNIVDLGDSNFDLVVIDEFQADLAHVFMPMANDRARQGLSTMCKYIRSAGEIYVCDAGLSNTHIEALKLLRPDKPSRVLVNNYKTWDGTTVDIVEGAASPDVVTAKLWAFLDEQNAARLDGKSWTGCTVPCHSRKQAVAHAAALRARYGEDTVRLYTSETDQHDKKSDFANVEGAWDELMAVVYTGTVSVGVSANISHLSHCFAFFKDCNAGSMQSCQMMFRARQLTHIDISYRGRVKFYPQTSDELYEWATLAANRKAIPDMLRADKMPDFVFDGEQTHSDPAALDRAVSRTFEGLSWMANKLEQYRSARWFTQRMQHTLEEAGCIVTRTAVAGKHVKVGRDLDIAPADLAAARTTIREAAAAGEHERNVLAAQEFNAAFESWDDANGNDTCGIFTAAELAGQRALHGAMPYAKGNGISLGQIQELTDVARTDWVAYHVGENGDNPTAYKNLTNIVCGRDTQGPAKVNEVQTDVASQAEASKYVRQIFDALNASASLMTGAECLLARDELDSPTPELVAAMDIVNANAFRVFGDSNAYRRKKACTSKGYNLRRSIGSINVALAYVGAEIAAVYDNATDRAHRNNARGYKIDWVFNTDLAPEPRPLHPHMDDYSALDEITAQ